MPNSTEAEVIARIMIRHLSVEQMAACFTELDAHVGQVSTNAAVKHTCVLLRQWAEAAARTSVADTTVLLAGADCGEAQRQRMAEQRCVAVHNFVLLWLLTWATVWLLHTILIAGNLAALLVLPFQAPWYIAFPGCSAIVWVMCSDVRCVITSLENRVRQRLGWKPVRGFVGHYYLRPLRRVRRAVVALLP